ncbi:MAG: homocysteine S-methyltransferase family protein [Planctomycetota bacterium]|nr:MAG: homocysteine S-methyltransferase family protein [Planctomycetota bacterium]
MTTETDGRRGLLQRLEEGPVICAEGYLFELERRGYLQAGAFVPEVVLEHPEVVEQLHREFARAGSDVIEAFTYYAHREKLRLIGKEDALESINRQALRIARSVAVETGGLLAGNICNTNIYDPGDAASHDAVRKMYEEQIGWAVDENADFLIAETISFLGEATIALDVMRSTGLPTVVTLAVHFDGTLRDGATPEEACKQLEDGGADVVGLNCTRGPATLLPLLKRIRERCDGFIAGLPVPYRTSDAEPTFQSLTDAACCSPESRPFPTALDPFVCTRYEIAEFAKAAWDIGVRYQGVCCGAGPHHIRSMAEALGKTPEASRYSPDMSKHYALGNDASLKQHNREFVKGL